MSLNMPAKPTPRHPAMTGFEIRDNCLVIGGSSVACLADQIGATPFYALDRSRLEARIELLRHHLPDGIKLNYAVKANPMPAVVQHLSGVVDGFDNTPLFAMATTWYQGLDDDERNLFLSKHSYQPGIVVYSKKWFDTLPKDIQEVLLTPPYDLTTWGREQVRQMEPVLIKNLVRYGYNVHEPTAEERAAFKAKEKGVPEKIAKETGPAGQALLKAVKKSLSKQAN